MGTESALIFLPDRSGHRIFLTAAEKYSDETKAAKIYFLTPEQEQDELISVSDQPCPAPGPEGVQVMKFTAGADEKYKRMTAGGVRQKRVEARSSRMTAGGRAKMSGALIFEN